MCLEAPTISGVRGVHDHFPAKKNPKWKISSITCISYEQSIDNSLLSSHEQFQPNWPKVSELWPKNVYPNIGMHACRLVQLVTWQKILAQFSGIHSY